METELWEHGVMWNGSDRSKSEIKRSESAKLKLDGRLSYQKLEIPEEGSEEYEEQRKYRLEFDPLELYFALPGEEETKGHQEKYGFLLYLTTEEKLSAAYFAKAVKKEAIKDSTVSEETPEHIHRVKSGETLSLIAPKYGIGWKTLATHNNIQSPYTIRIGQELKLPEDATIPEGTATSTASEQGNKKTATAYERIDSGTLGSEVYLVVETANLRGKKVDIEIFDQEKLLAEDDETAIKVIRDDQETDWINAVKIDDTGKAIVKVKLRKKSDEDYKKQRETLKDDKQARLFLKVTCQGDDRKHKKVFLKPIEEDQYIHPIAFGEYFKLIAGPKYNPDHGDFHDPIINPQVRGWYNPRSAFNKDSKIGGWNPYGSMKIHEDEDKIEDEKVKEYGDPQRRGRGHQGLDLYAPVGTPIYACVDGKITMYEMSGSAGFKIKLEGQYKEKHIRFNYIHLMQFEKIRFRFYNQNSSGSTGKDYGWLNYSDFATPSVHTDIKLKQQYKIHYDNGILKIDNNEIDVELALGILNSFDENQKVDVKKGQIIGYTGSTGNSYQGKKMNHLHFNTYINWKSVLPYETFKEYFSLDIEGTETSKKQDGVTSSGKW